MPSSVSTSLTASNLDGWMIASSFVIIFSYPSSCGLRMELAPSICSKPIRILVCPSVVISGRPLPCPPFFLREDTVKVRTLDCPENEKSVPGHPSI
jgi:hypothetical protein